MVVAIAFFHQWQDPAPLGSNPASTLPDIRRDTPYDSVDSDPGDNNSVWFWRGHGKVQYSLGQSGAAGCSCGTVHVGGAWSIDSMAMRGAATQRPCMGGVAARTELRRPHAWRHGGAVAIYARAALGRLCALRGSAAAAFGCQGGTTAGARCESRGAEELVAVVRASCANLPTAAAVKPVAGGWHGVATFVDNGCNLRGGCSGMLASREVLLPAIGMAGKDSS